jgi:hypothetical protein
MREVDKNNAIKPVSDPARAPTRQYEAAAVAGGRKGEGLYFPVNLDDEAIVGGMDPAADGDDPERGCLYFPVNSMDEPVRGDAEACRSLLIPNSGRSSPFAERGRLLRERAAAA